jgi:hypothetical protein
MATHPRSVFITAWAAALAALWLVVMLQRVAWPEDLAAAADPRDSRITLPVAARPVRAMMEAGERLPLVAGKVVAAAGPVLLVRRSSLP